MDTFPPMVDIITLASAAGKTLKTFSCFKKEYCFPFPATIFSLFNNMTVKNNNGD